MSNETFKTAEQKFHNEETAEEIAKMGQEYLEAVRKMSEKHKHVYRATIEVKDRVNGRDYSAVDRNNIKHITGKFIYVNDKEVGDK